MAGDDLYTVGEVATLLGVSPHTVRAWEQRHQIVSPVRTSSNQRRYRAEDVELLRDVKRATERYGLSLRVAFQAVSGLQVIDTRISKKALGRSPRLPRSSRQTIWRGVADVLPHLIFLLDPDGKIVEANIVAARVFGVTLQQLHGRAFADLADPFDRAKAVLLFRPRPRAVDNWELNLATAEGSRLYSFRTWTVVRGDETRLAMVGSEMFGGRTMPARPEVVLALDAANQPLTAGKPPPDALQALVDQLPFGVAVATVGRDPRIVYANLRVAKALGIFPRVFTGLPVKDLLPGTQLMRMLRAAVAKKAQQTLGEVTPPTGPRGKRRNFELVCQPLFSTSGQVAAVLIVMEEAQADSDLPRDLTRLIADPRFDRATSPRQLAKVAMRHLSAVLSSLPVAIGIASRHATGSKLSLAYSPAALITFRREPALARTFDQFIRRTKPVGRSRKVTLSFSGRQHVMTLMPFSLTRPLGFLAWLRDLAIPLSAAERSSIAQFAAGMRFATELLQARVEAVRKGTRLKSLVLAAAVIRDARSGSALGRRFLEHVAKMVGADGAAIGRIQGSEFVVEAAYAVGGPHAKVGDRFPLIEDHFVSASLRSRAPAESTDARSPALPPEINEALGVMKQFAAVPIIYMGGITHVITLSRKADVPFVEDDVRLVQALSGTALLIVRAMSDRTARSPSRARRAVSVSRSAGHRRRAEA